MKKLYAVFFASLLSISGCNPNADNTSTNTNTSNNISETSSSSSFNSSSSSSSSIDDTKYIDLDLAYFNTYKNYTMKYDANYEMFVEIYSSDIYYMVFSKENYIELESDPGYIHAFDSYRISDENADMSLNVYGRSGLKEDLKYFEESNFFSIIDYYIPLFKNKGGNLWQYQNSTLCKQLADFFQMKSLNYCQILEFTVGKDGRIESFGMLEKGLDGNYKVFGCLFEETILTENSMYQNWVSDGAIIDERIIDYKKLYEKENNLVSFYEGEEVEFEATVVAKDTFGNLYVANKMSNGENTGIKLVTPSSTEFNVGDVVKVKGTIATNNLNVVINEGVITSLNKTEKYPPIFDEEIVVNYNGGGSFAANAFAIVPYYSGSVYSTYAYVNKLPSALNEATDTVVEVECPSFNDGTNNFHMEIVIPSSLDALNKEKLYNALNNAGLYENGGYELRLENFVIEFDIEYYYHVRLLATNDSVVEKRKTIEEKIETYIGLDNFPVVNTESMVASYRFGEINGQYIEDSYGVDTHETEGLYIGYQEISKEEYNSYIESIELYGLELYDIIKDAYTGIHSLYTYNGTVIDVQYDSPEEGEKAALNIWLYNDEMIRTPNIKEKLNAAIGTWFDVDDFLVYNNTFDKDYTLFTLLDYANTSFTKENPLYCVGLDTQEPIMYEYCAVLVNELGFTQVRDQYISRGQLHLIFEKDGVYLDVSSYHTSDYTYSNHDKWQYRLEVLIYQAEEPMKITTYSNLDVLVDKFKAADEAFAYSINLPSGTVVEVWNNINDFRFTDVEYGYGCRDEAFVYSDDVENLYSVIKAGLESSGYVKKIEKTKSAAYSKFVGDEEKYIYLLKEPEKGYVRIMHDMSGYDFSI